MRIFVCLLSSLFFANAGVISDSVEISKVPAGFPVGFSLLTTPDRQYVGYYDAERNMVVASRELDSTDWVYQVLPTKVAWDSHNYVTMALDGVGHLHVSGNMHAVPLIYFRTEKAGDISSLKPEKMTGELENRVTYPRFLKDDQDRLVFTYRHGGSGNGINLYNRYDPKTKKWSRLLDTPLFDGEGLRNAYPNGPKRGPDGMFHVHWVWRETPDCATNHHLSYARSRDLIQWESASGEKIKLPIRFDQKALIVDPIPSGGGIINGGHKMGFDSENSPVLVYHKTDAKGNMQVYAARPEGGKWVHQVLTDWQHPVEFSGGGSMGFIGIKIGDVEQVKPDVFSVSYRHQDYGNGILQFDAKTLNRLEKRLPVAAGLPRELNQLESDFPGMEIRRATDMGSSGVAGVRYVLQWETLGANRDKPRKQPLPEPSRLKLYKLTGKN